MHKKISRNNFIVLQFLLMIRLYFLGLAVPLITLSTLLNRKHTFLPKWLLIIKTFQVLPKFYQKKLISKFSWKFTKIHEILPKVKLLFTKYGHTDLTCLAHISDGLHSFLCDNLYLLISICNDFRVIIKNSVYGWGEILTRQLHIAGIKRQSQRWKMHAFQPVFLYFPAQHRLCVYF
jgi:hypothetical protein